MQIGPTYVLFILAFSIVGRLSQHRPTPFWLCRRGGLRYWFPSCWLTSHWLTGHWMRGHWLCSIGLFCSPVTADDLSLPEPMSVLSSDYSQDSSGGQGLYLNASLAVGLHQRLTLGLGENNQTLAASREQLETSIYHVGYAVETDRNIALGLEYERWGEEGVLITDTLRFSVVWDLPDWSFTLAPQRREIELSTRCNERLLQLTGECKKLPSLFSNGLALGIDYLGIEQWFFSIGYLINRYSEDLVAAKRNTKSRIVLAYLNQLQSVTDRSQLILGASYFVDTSTLGISWQRNESDMDASLTYATTLFFSADVFNHWSITLSLGQQINVDDSTTEYIGGGLNYYW